MNGMMIAAVCVIPLGIAAALLLFFRALPRVRLSRHARAIARLGFADYAAFCRAQASRLIRVQGIDPGSEAELRLLAHDVAVGGCSGDLRFPSGVIVTLVQKDVHRVLLDMAGDAARHRGD